MLTSTFNVLAEKLAEKYVKAFQKGVFMQDFSVFKRTRTNSLTKWCVQFREPSTGKFGNAYSLEGFRAKIGIEDTTPIKTRTEAIRIAQAVFNSGICFKEISEKRQTLAQYCKDYWDFNKEDGYIQRKNARCPNSIGLNHAMHMRSYFITHVEPLLKKGLKVSEVTNTDVENVQNKLLMKMDKGAFTSGTCKKIMQSLTSPLKEAYRTRLIAINPIDRLETITAKVGVRGVPTAEEIEKLVEVFREYIKIGGMAKRVALMSLLSIATGMRQGECRALKPYNISFGSGQLQTSVAVIHVCESFADKVGEKDPKGKTDRYTPCPTWLAQELVNLAKQNPYDNKFVFWGDTPNSPLGQHAVRRYIDMAYEKIGVTREEKLERQLCFHSFRHYYNTNTRGLVSDYQLQCVMGHKSIAMTERYYHGNNEIEAEKVGLALVGLDSWSKAI